ncbi:MAG TPA: hypothetical protein V6C58_19240 [Allocoleopsis sp.]
MYSARQYNGEPYDVDHWLFFTWSDNSVSNYITVEASSEEEAIGRAKSIYNPCEVMVK